MQAVREHIRAMTQLEFDRPEFDEKLEQDLEPPAYDRLNTIHAPTLIISGEVDVPHINANMAHAAATIPGAQHVIIHGAAHHLPLEKPEEFSRVVVEFLKGIR